ncbi:MAG TPA: BMP family ABC transporter substrate-binding protein [Acidimicrobiia bacterium]|nr:BMP family ABC transporter substrate-binding protein [Acidimicrobiia bacterium]
MKRYIRYLAIFAVLGLVLAACSPEEGGEDTTTTEAPAATTTEAPEGTTTSADDATTTTAEEMEFTALATCFVTDDAGVDDRSFNASGWQGVQDAVASGAVQPDPILLESTSEADYQPHVETCLDQGAEHIVTSGFKLGPTTETFAAANPDVQFTIIDFPSNGPNVAGTEFQTDEAAFAAGYLAAGVTQTGIVSTYGGANIPTVSIFLDGFTRGVAHYNEVKGADVRVIGWDVEAQDGSFTGVFDPADPIVRATCESQLDEGADIVLPVGGAINLPCGTAIQDRGIDGALIGVDADAFDAMPAEFQDLWLVTILKGLASGVTTSIEAHASGEPLGGSSYVGNLENDGVGLSDFHSWSDRVPEELAAETAQVLEDIRSGVITWDKFVVGGG